MYVGSKLAIPRDAKLGKGLINAKLGYRSYEKNDTVNISYRFEETCKKHPNREALVFEGKSYTFQDIQRGMTLKERILGSGIQVHTSLLLSACAFLFSSKGRQSIFVHFDKVTKKNLL